MEHIAAQDLETTDQAWKADREEACHCANFDVPSLVDRVLDRWKSASIGYRAMALAELDRAKSLSLARSLREAEQTLVAVASAAFPLFRESGDRRMYKLMFALMRCRMLIVLPVARRMAEQDETGRSADEIAHLLAEEAQFIEGRAVINQALAAELPSPYKTEGANA
jgi:hypothetical protein